MSNTTSGSRISRLVQRLRRTVAAWNSDTPHYANASLAMEPRALSRPLGSECRGDRFYADLATCVWRIRRKVTSGDAAESVLRSVHSQTERMCDLLAEGGIEFQELLGEKYVDGMAVRVLAFQPEVGGDYSISEVIAPGIFIDGRLRQTAEVVVCIPESPPMAPEANSSEGAAQPPPDAPESADSTNNPEADRTRDPATVDRPATEVHRTATEAISPDDSSS